MTNYRFRLPSMSALSAFESAARNCNFSRAAEELSTSQPAVSRHISGLEAQLGTRLFERQRSRVALTADGRRLYHAVVAGFQEIGRAVDELRRHPRQKQLTIACSTVVKASPRACLHKHRLYSASAVRQPVPRHDEVRL